MEPRDLGYLEDYGIEPDEVSTLPDHEYIIHGVDSTIEAIQFEWKKFFVFSAFIVIKSLALKKLFSIILLKKYGLLVVKTAQK